MKTSFGILVRDLKKLARNPVAFIVVAALLVLPGLYAWYCIMANWDPYSNTGNMPIAIVNEDKGAESDLTGKVNIGERVTESLKDNDSIDWVFYDSESEALEDTAHAVCYATIVFPEDLSELLIGIFDGSEEQPTIRYYPNEKANAVATKVTDSAAKALIQEINQQFSSTVNETLLEKAQEAANKTGEKTDDMSKSSLATMRETKKDIDKVAASLDETISSIEGWRDAVAGSQDSLDGAEAQLPAIRSALDQGSKDLKTLRKQTEKFNGDFSKALLDSGSALGTLAGTASARLGKASADAAAANGAVDALVNELESILDALFSGGEAPEVEEEIRASLEKLRETSADLAGAIAKADASAERLNESVSEANEKTTKASEAFSDSILPQLSEGTNELADSLAKASGAVGQFEPQIGELRNVLAQTDDALARSIDSILGAKELLLEVSGNLKATISDLGTMGSALQIDQVADLLEIDPDTLGRFISSPVNMATEKIYPVSNYGSSVAPFYTNLALWIGAFILISLIKLEVDRTGFEEASATQRYFGRWLLLVILAVLQSQVICGVDILLGIDCQNPALFMLAGAVCSFTYMNLIFALAIAFRNIGKTLCILLLIMQVPGSSGMYPIEMMPDFFQTIHPLLPFTYGIDAMREALCGTYGLRYLYDLLPFVLIVAASLLLGVVIRPYLMNLEQLFDTELGRAGFFASEEHAQRHELVRLRNLMRAIARDESYRDRLEERAWAFKRRYPSLRRAGSMALFALPIAFIIIMFPLGLLADFDMNTKLNMLMLMLVILLVVQAGLIVLEYAHNTIVEETEMLGTELLNLEDFGIDELVEGPQADSAAETADDAGEAAADEAAAEAEAESPEAVEDEEGVEAEDTELANAEAGDEEAPEGAGLAADAEDAEAGDEEAGDQEAGSSRTAKQALAAIAPLATGPARKRESVARHIFQTDLKLGFQSAIGAVVIILLVITPSMYAWFNIAGSWDPYANTGGLKVAVSNLDEGYKGDLVPITVNIGDSIVSQLRGNDNFDWEFVDQEDAIHGVESGAYYAAIVIPETFSENMLTYLGKDEKEKKDSADDPADDPDYPDVIYYTNEKENPIAPIITQKGATSIQENIRTSFTQRIDEVALTVSSDLASYLTKPSVSGYAAKMGDHLGDATHDMGTGATELKSLSDLTALVAGVVQTAGVTLDGLRATGESAEGAIGTAKKSIDSASSAFEEASALIDDLMSGNTSSLDDMEADVDAVLAALEGHTSNVPAALREVGERVDSWIEVLKALQGELTDEDDPAIAEKLEAMIQALEKLSGAIYQAADNADATPASIESVRAELAALTSDTKSIIASAKSFYEQSVEGSAENLKGSISTVSESAESIVGGLKDTVDGLSGTTDDLVDQLVGLSDGLGKTSGKLDKAAKRIDDAKQKLTEALESGDTKRIERILLGGDMALMAERLAAPVREEREPMFPIMNFGSSMAPFYTVLSLWVGALVMISTMRVHLSEERLEELRKRFPKVRTRDEFFGRYGIFGFISLLQSAVVLLGDMLFLGIQCSNPLAFFLLGLFIGQVFCLIVYTLTELFGDVGKALCVILLIMQVAASGGTFPVEMLDPFLESIVPFLPFWHAMCMLKECVAGIDFGTIAIHASILVSVVGIMLLVGVVVRKPFRIVNDFLEHQLEKTGYM